MPSELWDATGVRMVAFVALLVMSCAHNVTQDAHTGPDGSANTPRRIQLVNNKASVRGVVTYPGGDRADWILVTLPAKLSGRLDITLDWISPRPGLQLRFNAFDATFRRVASTPPEKVGGARTQTVKSATGHVFIQVYAPNRGDAGAYRLTFAFEADYICVLDRDRVHRWDPPDPPRLPAVPPIDESSCDGCPPDSPIALILKTTIAGHATLMEVSAGSAQGIARTRRAQVLQGDTDQPIDGGDAVIIRIDEQTTILKVKLTPDQLKANPRVRFTPPWAE